MEYVTQAHLTANSHIGTTLPEDKPEHIIQLFCINPNGISITSQKKEFVELCQTMSAFQVDTFCTPKHNLDTHQHHIKRKLYDTAQQLFDHTKLSLSSSTIPSTSTFKPDGTLMTMQGATQARIMNTGTDPLRWWAYQTFVCKNHHKLTAVMAYQPCQQGHTQNTKICTLTVHAQQSSLLQQQGRHCTPQQPS